MAICGERYVRATHVIPAYGPRETGTTSGIDVSLELVVHSYTIINAPTNGFTWVVTHGTSFNKDLWQLIIDELLEQPQIRSRTTRILALDAATHGDSAVRNRFKLGEKAHWPDCSRDILQALEYFKCRGPILGIGHSFGGGILCHAAMMRPDVFTATIFVEPIVFVMGKQDQGAAAVALKRRDVWSSLDEVKAAFSKGKGLADWDRRQLQIYAELGTYSANTSSAERTLKTPKKQEAATYGAAPYPGLLDLIQESKGRHHFIFGAKSIVLDATKQQHVASIINERSTIKVMPGVGHLIPMTNPEQLAAELTEIIETIYADIAEIPAVAARL